VAFVMDGNSSIIPSDSDITRVTDYIAGHPNPITGVIEGQPEGPEVTVFAPKLKPLDMTIKISPKTDALKDEITKGLASLFYNKCDPGSTLTTSSIVRVIAASQSLTDFELISPTSPTYSAADELLVPGTITWS
ncbi:TPA: baseplate J/gp47 family protein, partial [Enterobacter asburiae]|nr:baseplate J/gp47 family protein [Enterobacter asburiae]HDR2775118.1 baseplate J/gp47 family protein [Enterobacter asburiae]